MNLDYIITYTDHRGDSQEVCCSVFEDAERLAKFLADLYMTYGPVTVSDGEYVCMASADTLPEWRRL